jgi:hypothetical protein
MNSLWLRSSFVPPAGCHPTITIACTALWELLLFGLLSRLVTEFVTA